MSDTQSTGAGEAQQQPPIVINGQYIKDLSFESPNSPGIFQDLQTTQPEMQISVNVAHAKLDGADNAYEVVLEFNAQMKLGDKVGFICELKYSGLFTLNIPEEHIQAFLLIECPRMLFPYARQIISDSTQQGGFVPLWLQPIDFAAMYQQSVKNQLGELDADVAQAVQDQGGDN